MNFRRKEQSSPGSTIKLHRKSAEWFLYHRNSGLGSGKNFKKHLCSNSFFTDTADW